MVKSLVMETLSFEISIQASKEKVWKTLWGDETYRQWTSIFGEGSRVETDWQEGSSIRFLAGGGEGIYGNIYKKVPNEIMVFKHQGLVVDGKNQPLDGESQNWFGAREEYSLTEENQKTRLRVDLEITSDTKDYFAKTFPKAMESVKELSEEKSSGL